MPKKIDNNTKGKKIDNTTKQLPSEVLLKAKSTLFSLGGALRTKQDQRRGRNLDNTKDKNMKTVLKVSRSEPEFSEIIKNSRMGRIDDPYISRDRPQSFGACGKHNQTNNNSMEDNFSSRLSLQPKHCSSTEDSCLQSRTALAVTQEKNNCSDLPTPENSEKPRKKLSFREPEIVSTDNNMSQRCHKLMGVNSLSRRRPRLPPRNDPHSLSLESLDSDLESQAMRIVRTVGQAFEVCHKQQQDINETGGASTSSLAEGSSIAAAPAAQPTDIDVFKITGSECDGSESGAISIVTPVEVIHEDVPTTTKAHQADFLEPPPKTEGRRTPQSMPPLINLPELPECVTKVDVSLSNADEANTPLSAQHQLQLLRERLEQQAQQTRAAVAQLLLLRDQLAAEQAARCEAQARTHQLLVHNKELLEHIAALVAHLQDRERGTTKPISAQQLTLIPQLSSSAKIDRWFSLLPHTPALSRPESGFISGMDEANEAATLAEARNLLLRLGAKKKKRRFFPIRFTRRKIVVNKRTLL